MKIWIKSKSIQIFEELTKEIQDEVLIPREQEDLMEHYLRHHGKFVLWNSTYKPKGLLSGLPISTDAHHPICGMCGVTTI